MRGPEELFALTLTDAINEVARQGWEYVRAEHLPAEKPRGWFRGATAAEQTVLVFRRAREMLGPRLARSAPSADDRAVAAGLTRCGRRSARDRPDAAEHALPRAAAAAGAAPERRSRRSRRRCVRRPASGRPTRELNLRPRPSRSPRASRAE